LWRCRTHRRSATARSSSISVTAKATFADQVIDQFNFLHREAGAQGGRIMAITLHPWVIGQPHRIGALERALEHIVSKSDVWSATGDELVEVWTAAQRAAERA
jgi:peptidoglycan/xylan/chitin deacetylase (PgdA/CDA1 family)